MSCCGAEAESAQCDCSSCGCSGSRAEHSSAALAWFGAESGRRIASGADLGISAAHAELQRLLATHVVEQDAEVRIALRTLELATGGDAASSALRPAVASGIRRKSIGLLVGSNSPSHPRFPLAAFALGVTPDEVPADDPAAEAEAEADSTAGGTVRALPRWRRWRKEWGKDDNPERTAKCMDCGKKHGLFTPPKDGAEPKPPKVDPPKNRELDPLGPEEQEGYPNRDGELLKESPDTEKDYEITGALATFQGADPAKYCIIQWTRSKMMVCIVQDGKVDAVDVLETTDGWKLDPGAPSGVLPTNRDAAGGGYPFGKLRREYPESVLAGGGSKWILYAQCRDFVSYMIRMDDCAVFRYYRWHVYKFRRMGMRGFEDVPPGASVNGLPVPATEVGDGQPSAASTAFCEMLSKVAGGR